MKGGQVPKLAYGSSTTLSTVELPELVPLSIKGRSVGGSWTQVTASKGNRRTWRLL